MSKTRYVIYIFKNYNNVTQCFYYNSDIECIISCDSKETFNNIVEISNNFNFFS